MCCFFFGFCRERERERQKKNRTKKRRVIVLQRVSRFEPHVRSIGAFFVWTQNSQTNKLFYFCVCEREFFASLSLSLFFFVFFVDTLTLVCCVCSRQIITSSSQEARKSSTTTFAFSSFETREAIVYLVFAQRRRGQAALASSLCRSEQRRCDLTAASFCPLPRGIIVID